MVDNIETTLTYGAKNPAGDTGANNRLVKGMDKIVDKMEMALTDDCAMRRVATRMPRKVR